MKSLASDTARTASILKTLFNSLEKDLEFTVETSEEFNSETLPTLDTQIWIEHTGEHITPQHPTNQEPNPSCNSTKTQTIKYKFYRNPMGTEYVLMEGSGASYNSKKASLTQCVVTRLINTSDNLDQTSKNEILDTFTKKSLKNLATLTCKPTR